MKTQNIEVEGLSEGWEVEKLVLRARIENNETEMIVASLVTLKKIQPRRMVLEETGEEMTYPINGYMYGYIDGAGFVKYKILREVKETDIPLTNEVKMGVSQGDGVEPNLELSVKELRNVRSLIKDFENLGWFINPERALLLQKITEFIKDK